MSSHGPIGFFARFDCHRADRLGGILDFEMPHPEAGCDPEVFYLRQPSLSLYLMGLIFFVCAAVGSPAARAPAPLLWCGFDIYKLHSPRRVPWWVIRRVKLHSAHAATIGIQVTHFSQSDWIRTPHEASCHVIGAERFCSVLFCSTQCISCLKRHCAFSFKSAYCCSVVLVHGCSTKHFWPPKRWRSLRRWP